MDIDSGAYAVPCPPPPPQRERERERERETYFICNLFTYMELFYKVLIF